MTDTNVRLNTAKELISKGGNVCYAPTEIKRHSVDSSPTDFQIGRNDFRILCEGGVCTVQQLVPKVQSFRTEALQALAAIVTLGLTSCSSNEAPKEWQDVAEFQDSKTGDTNLTQPEIQGQPNDVSETSISSTVCYDNDDSNYFKAGFVSMDPGKPTQKTYIDICKDTAFLYEQTCDGNQYKKVIVKCADVLPGGMCVESDGGGKCDLGLKYTVDAGTSDSGNDSPDISTPIDTGPDVPDVPPVDYLKLNPLPLALNTASPYIKFAAKPGLGPWECFNKNSPGFIHSASMSKCIYLKELDDIDGNPIITSSYSDLVNKIATSKGFLMAVIEGDGGEYPKTSVNKKVAFSVSAANPTYSINPGATSNVPTIVPAPGGIIIQFLEKPSPDLDDTAGCLFDYVAPNGFAQCVK